jgi:hypothetical protein
VVTSSVKLDEVVCFGGCGFAAPMAGGFSGQDDLAVALVFRVFVPGHVAFLFELVNTINV